MADLLSRRRSALGGNVRLAYRRPVHIVRGSMQYLWDADGRRYLDAYNNVPHVGHCHPRVVAAGHGQMAQLNTNTRYLHEIVPAFAEQLSATLPKPLRVCFLVNSGSEANELALRLARAHTHHKHLIVLESAYHGNTTSLIDISPYKHNGPGGEHAPDWVHVAPVPDLYRGPYKRSRSDAGQRYAAEAIRLVEELSCQRRGLAGFMAESWPSVAGQLELPRDYLARVYAAVRKAGGVCIADEVQIGYGRIGSGFWGFEAYEDAIPDIVTLGKPMGNGHPLGAVVTTPEIAASFDNGMEFFSTFGGNTVSCAIGLAVLEVLRSDGLQEHALRMGNRLLNNLNALMRRHMIIGDVRGAGLFLGVELVQDRTTLAPAKDEADAVVDVLREAGVLIGTDGPLHNVLKIRPPMPFNADDADFLIEALDRALSEVGARRNG